MPRSEFPRLAAAVLAVVATAFVPAAFAQQASPSQLTGLKLSGNLPIQIESDRLEVREQENIAIFSGNVNVKQGEALMKSGKMTVYYAKEGEGSAATGSSAIDRIEVDDKVYIKSEAQVATGDRGTFDMKTEVLELTGKEVVLSEGPNVLIGCKLVVQMRTGHAEVTGCGSDGGTGGRVMMSITPSSAQQNNP